MFNARVVFVYWRKNVISPEVLETISSAVLCNSGQAPSGRLAVHVRRGDMVGKTDELLLSYFIRAYSLLMEKPGLPTGTEVDVFSDDPDWCHKNLPFPTGVIHRQSKASADLANFATYDHQILSASTFSWWVARLRPNNSGVVVAPLPFALAAPNLRSAECWISVKR